MPDDKAQAADDTRKLRARFPRWGILFDPLENVWIAVRGKRTLVVASSPEKLTKQVGAAVRGVPGPDEGDKTQAWRAVVASRQADRNCVTWMTDSRIAGPARSCQMVNQEASEMNMICRWVHADNGALVMEWTKAEDSEVHWGTGGNEVAYAFEVSDHNADALTSVAV